MAFSKDYVGGALIVNGNKVRINEVNSGGYQELTANEPLQSATWSGDEIIVVTQSGKAYRYETNGMYRYA